MQIANDTFIADVHLGKLAKALRMLGFDVLYRNDFTNETLKRAAAEQSRVLLSRNHAFAKDPTIKTCILKSEEWFVQLQQVIQEFELNGKFKPFTRCLVCNGFLQSVSKLEIANCLEEKTRNYFNAFWQCDSCGRIYWKGSHFERMERIIKQLTTGQADQSGKR